MSGSSERKKSIAKCSKLSVRMCVREPRDILSMSSPDVYHWPIPMRAVGAQNLLTMPGGVTFSGYLHKKGGSQLSLMRWPLRYIIIHKGCVYYFRSSTSPSPQGAFSLNGYNRVIRAAEETTSNNVFPFKLLHFSKKHRTWFFSAASEEERREWMRSLRWEIEHYNERKESHVHGCDFDSDADGFYGSIERVLDLKQPQDVTDHDYVDDDDDDKDYLMPDRDATIQSTGRPTFQPPSYPPPPVPQVSQIRQQSSPVFHEVLPPPVPPHNRPSGNSWVHKSPSPSSVSPSSSIQRESHKGPPPPLPFVPHLKRPTSFTPVLLPSPKQSHTPVKGAEDERKDRKSSVPSPLPFPAPISDQFHSKMNLNGPPHFPPNAKGGVVSTQASALQNKNLKPPVPEKPPRPANKPRRPGLQLQTSPEGRSFRSHLGDTKRMQNSSDIAIDSDEDYENMQLPDSVFVDTTETSAVERLFKENSCCPEDGLYCIRNSGTKTSKVLVVWDVSISKARNYRLFTMDNQIFLDSEVPFTTLSHLVEHYHTHPLPQHGSLCLQKPFTNN
ncbi:SH3 domain-binding protein 2 isoform X3 [Synchiropus splendidus]|uniref:SH3 domain-binding protein 2 isoform X3 n=1 Tax=Synchiropus splendidus TaxID=270530 RepID=UPI00237D9DEF|nr:SH3 domain-binding protein 2 isoform X3 [Synchiropus splendidus]